MQNTNQKIIMGIETSCDDTAVAIINSNKEILSLSEAYKEIFKTKNLSENLANLDNKFVGNILVKDVIDFINKDKKRPICTPYSK